MPTYYPLFNSSFSPARRVFNAAGAPVFARIRSGSATLTITISGSATSDSNVIGGSMSHTFNYTLYRSSFQVFDTASTIVWSDYVDIGMSDIYHTYLRLACESVSVIYSSGFCPAFLATLRRYIKVGTQYVVYDGTYRSFSSSSVSSAPYILDGNHPVIPSSYTQDLLTITPSDVVMGFVES